MVLLLSALGLTGENHTLNKDRLHIVWRLQYSVAFIALAALTVYRALFNKETSLWQVRPRGSCSLASSWVWRV